jgi:hypothetical protein
VPRRVRAIVVLLVVGAGTGFAIARPTSREHAVRDADAEASEPVMARAAEVLRGLSTPPGLVSTSGVVGGAQTARLTLTVRGGDPAVVTAFYVESLRRAGWSRESRPRSPTGTSATGGRSLFVNGHWMLRVSAIDAADPLGSDPRVMVDLELVRSTAQ